MKKETNKKSFSFEIYTNNHKTGERGWDIMQVEVFSTDKKEAKIVLKTFPHFDCIILFNNESELSKEDLKKVKEGYVFRIQSCNPNSWCDKGEYFKPRNVLYDQYKLYNKHQYKIYNKNK